MYLNDINKNKGIYNLNLNLNLIFIIIKIFVNSGDLYLNNPTLINTFKTINQRCFHNFNRCSKKLPICLRR
jgi:hypothetical protein